MPDVAIRAVGLSKVYPLASSPRERLLYVLGLKRSVGHAIATKASISDIDLVIHRGEKVGIIGRNGAGKSTLLGMFSGTIEPTRGRLTVSGSVHALLQLGAGFNPDLTGRENACSYLALQGIPASQTDRRVAEIAEFAEIGIYFDQPFRTYSTGMRLRLMFAAATIISPDILILDEVLSVGDAYFVGKSFERMRDLSSGQGTTLIVVSHSVSMLPELCDRIIWIDDGTIRMDGAPDSVARAYDAFIRTEEENRLRRLHAARPVRQLSALPGDSGTILTTGAVAPPVVPDEGVADLVGEIRLSDGQPPSDRLVIRRIEFRQNGERVADVPIGAGEQAGDAILVTGEGAGNWGTCQSGDPVGGRPFLAYGSPFHKLPFVIRTPRLRTALENAPVDVRLTCKGEFSGELEVGMHAPHDAGHWRACLTVPGTTGTFDGTIEAKFLAIGDTPAPDDAKRLSSYAVGRFGTRRIELTDIRFLGGDDQPRLVYSIGMPFRVAMRYRVNDPDFDENAEIVVAFQRDGLQVTNRFFLNEYRFCAGARRDGEVLLDATPLLLGPGEYTVSVAVHAVGHATRKTPRDHFAVSQTVYDMYYRCFQITVFEPYHTTLLQDVIFQHPATWIVDSEEFQRTAITD